MERVFLEGGLQHLIMILNEILHYTAVFAKNCRMAPCPLVPVKVEALEIVEVEAPSAVLPQQNRFNVVGDIHDGPFKHRWNQR